MFRLLRSLVFFLGIAVFFPVFPQSNYNFEDQFEDNRNHWPLPNSSYDQTMLGGGSLKWSHKGQRVKVISNYFNRLSEQSDFSVEVLFTVMKPGSQYGLMWGGINDQDAHFVRIKNLKYQLLESNAGVYATVQDYTNPLKLKLNANRIKVERKGSQLVISLNGDKVKSMSFPKMKGKAFGFALWEDAKVQVEEFKLNGQALAINKLENLEFPGEPQNLGKGVNSEHDELTPVISPDAETIYFTRKYAPTNLGGPSDYQDIYVSTLENGQWGQAENIGAPLNNHGPNAVCAITPDGNKVLLMNTYAPDGTPKGMGMSISQRGPKGWELPKEVKMHGFYNRSMFNEFFLANDGRTILMAVERDDTRGSRDIYVSKLNRDQTWSTPKSLGTTINTAGIELSPFLASDGETLYFSSTGHPGFGKNDIFMSRRLDNSWTKWSKPVNLGPPINTPGRDAYYSVPASGDYAYFLSDKGSIGKNDIFKVALPGPVKPKPVLLVRGKVLNSKNNRPIATAISIYELETGEEVGVARSSHLTGKYEIALPVGKEYGFYAEKKGFYAVREHLDLTTAEEGGEMEKNLYLTPIEAGQAVSLNNIFFVRSKAVLLPKSFPELNRLAQMLDENAKIIIQLEGHTDNTGSAELNVKLSRERAEKVKGYLVDKGVNPERITTIGYGGERPIASNDREETRKLNRRVEFRILNF